MPTGDGAQNAQPRGRRPCRAVPGSCACHAVLCLPRTEGSMPVGAQNRFILVTMSPPHTPAQGASAQTGTLRAQHLLPASRPGPGTASVLRSV